MEIDYRKTKIKIIVSYRVTVDENLNSALVQSNIKDQNLKHFPRIRRLNWWSWNRGAAVAQYSVNCGE